MKILYSFTLQGQIDVDKCLKNIKDSKIPLNKCRFCYCDNDTKQYLLTKKIFETQIIKSCGLNKDLDYPLNAMRLSKNKPDYTIIALNETKITRYVDFEEDLQQFSKSLENKFCMFSTSFMNPCKKHLANHIDSRVLICNGIHKDIMNNYVDTCELLDKSNGDLSSYPKIYTYTNRDVLENMNMNSTFSINFNGMKSQTLFQQFFLMHLSDY